MKLITHNILTSNILKGVTKGFPLKIKAVTIENVSVDYNRDFITRILQRIEYDAVKEAVTDVSLSLRKKIEERFLVFQLGLNETLPETIQEDDEFLKKMHKILLEYEVEEGELICPETGRKFPISKGIPNMLLQETELS
jgi:multifunctional methyltransferase subunit TRM112